MKLSRRRIFFTLGFWISAIFVSVKLMAMFAPFTDSDLLEHSSLIVQADYVGQSEVQLGTEGGSVCLGVLNVRAVLKGNVSGGVVLLAVPSPTRMMSGSDIVFKPGQTGWWFLRERSDGAKGIFLADHPQRFIPAGSDDAKVEALKKALRARQ